MAATEIEIKRIEAGGGGDNRFAELFRKCFKQQKDISYFKWKYFDNPAGHIIGYEALSKGRTVGSFCVVPEYYYFGGEKIRIFIGADAMVSPRFWGKKLFEQMARKVQADVMKEEGTFIVAFPGILSFGELINNLDWQIVEKNCQYIFTIRPYLRLRNLFSSAGNAKVCEFSALDKELEDYLKLMKPQACVAKFFDPAVFQWKVFDNPNHEYKVVGIKKDGALAGICVYRRDTAKSCEISYVNFADVNDYKKYLPLFTKHIFAEAPVRYVYTWKPPAGFLAEAYKSGGFMTNRLPKGPFRDTFPFVVYEKDTVLSANLRVFDDIDFQPILFD